MIKYIIIFSLFFTLSFANNIDNTIELKNISSIVQYKKSENIVDILNKLTSNYNKLLFGQISEEKQDKILKTNEKLFNDFFEILNNNKNIDISSYINFNKIHNEYIYLNRKIEINRSNGNSEAVHRDIYRLNYLKIKEHIAKFIIYYKQNRDSSHFKSLIKDKIHQDLSFLDNLNILKDKSYVDSYKDKASNSKVISRMVDNYQKLSTIYFLYKDLLNFLDNKIKTELTDKLIEELYFVQLADAINNNRYIPLEKINIKLEKYGINIGKIVISFLLFIIFIFGGILLNKLLVNKIDNYISIKYSKNSDIKDILHLSFLKIKGAILLVMGVTSLHISLAVLYFGNNTNIYIEKSIVILHIIAFYWFILTIIDVIALILFNSKKYRNKLFVRKELANLSVFSLKIVISIIAILIILHTSGLNISGILTGLGISGIVVAYGLRNSLNNFFGTLSSVMNDIYSLGDWIEFDGKEGTVAEINFSTTKIRTFDNALITVPNNYISSIPVTNWSRRKYGRRIKFILNITYNSKRENVKKAIDDINSMLEEHPDIATPRKNIDNLPKDRKSKLMNTHDVYGIKNTMFVKLIGFNESSIDILIYIFSKTVDWGKWLDVKQDILFKIWEILEKNNLEFAYPTRTIILKDNYELFDKYNL